MSAFVFGDLDVSRWCLARIDRPVGPAARVESEQVPGRDGEVLVSVGREPVKFVAHLTLRPRHRFDWPDVRLALAEAFSANAEKRLHLPDEDGRWRWAVASLVGDVTTPIVDSPEFDVEFTCCEPFSHGAVRSVTVPSGGSATFLVGGTYPTRPAVAAESAVRDPTTGLWGLRLDDARTLHVPVPVATASAVSVDCASRVVRVDGATSMVTLASDWWELAPGSHAVAMTQGTGAATVTWEERWL